MSATYLSMGVTDYLFHTAVAGAAGFVAGMGAYAVYKQMYPDSTIEEAASFAAKMEKRKLEQIKQKKKETWKILRGDFDDEKEQRDLLCT